MSDDPQKNIGLPDDVLALLDSASLSDEESPSAASSRVWERLDQALDLGPLPTSIDVPQPDGVDVSSMAADAVVSTGAASAKAAGATLSVSKVAAAIWTASTFALGTVTGVGTHAVFTQPEEPVVSVHKEVPAASPDMSVSEVVGMNEADMMDMSMEDVVDMPVPNAPDSASDLVDIKAKVKVVEPRQDKKTLLESERLMLTRAQRALTQGDGAEALSVLRSHEARYGAGSPLAEERAFLIIRALLLVGKESEAKQAIVVFQKRYPSSIFLDAIGVLP